MQWHYSTVAWHIFLEQTLINPLCESRISVHVNSQISISICYCLCFLVSTRIRYKSHELTKVSAKVDIFYCIFTYITVREELPAFFVVLFHIIDNSHF